MVRNHHTNSIPASCGWSSGHSLICQVTYLGTCYVWVQKIIQERWSLWFWGPVFKWDIPGLWQTGEFRTLHLAPDSITSCLKLGFPGPASAHSPLQSSSLGNDYNQPDKCYLLQLLLTIKEPKLQLNENKSSSKTSNSFLTTRQLGQCFIPRIDFYTLCSKRKETHGKVNRLWSAQGKSTSSSSLRLHRAEERYVSTAR